MTLLSAESVGGNRADVVSLALSFELLHTATLIHDDILDHEEFRRNSLSIHKKWSVNDAILVGDVMISLAVNLAADYGKSILKIISETGVTICDGEYMDISMNSIKMTEQEYVEKIRKKTALLFRASAQCGGIAGGGSPFEVKCLAGYGEKFGLAYQLRDDLSDIASLRTGISSDLQLQRISLPLIHLYTSSSSMERNLLLHDLEIMNKNHDFSRKQAFNRVLQSLLSKNSLKYCKVKIDEYVAGSIANIEPLKKVNPKSHLCRMVKLLRDPQF